MDVSGNIILNFISIHPEHGNSLENFVDNKTFEYYDYKSRYRTLIIIIIINVKVCLVRVR